MFRKAFLSLGMLLLVGAAILVAPGFAQARGGGHGGGGHGGGGHGGGHFGGAHFGGYRGGMSHGGSPSGGRSHGYRRDSPPHRGYWLLHYHPRFFDPTPHLD